MSRALRLALVLLLVAEVAHAGGWTQAEDGYYAKAWWRSVTGKRVYTAGGGRSQKLPERFGDQALNLYGEYGLRDDLTLVFSATPYGYASFDDASTSYVGPLVGGARWGLGASQFLL